MTPDIRESVAEIDPEMLLADGFEGCIIGYIERAAQPPFVVYSRELVLKQLMEQDGLEYEDAVEHFNFNVAGSWVGDRTPGFLVTFGEETALE